MEGAPKERETTRGKCLELCRQWLCVEEMFGKYSTFGLYTGLPKINDYVLPQAWRDFQDRILCRQGKSIIEKGTENLPTAA